MRLAILFILVIHSLNAQDSTKYRFSYGVSGISIMHYGLKDLKNVTGLIYPDYHKVYQSESYTLDYQDLSFSKGINYNASVTAFNKPNYYLKIGVNVFFEKYKEKMTYTLTDIRDGSLIDYGSAPTPFTPDNVPLGYSENVIFSNDKMSLSGMLLEVSFMYELQKNWNIGGGLFYVTRGRLDKYETEIVNSYQPWGVPRGTDYYNTKQVGVSIELQKSIGRFNGFINLSQTAITTKLSEKKGGGDYRYYQPWAPLSQNLDFRFPLIISLGVNVEFGRIKH